ncbi:MAG: radical SAM protein [Bacteroidota bacterium]
MNFKAFLNTVSEKVYTLPIVILYVTEACNLKCTMCSYRERLPSELSLDEIADLAIKLQEFGLRRVVYSGGEPLLRRDFPAICKVFRSGDVKQTLLTNGLLLEKRIREVASFLDELIVSLDGATDLVHNEIRGVNSFGTVLRGIRRVKESNPQTRLALRMVVQKKNFREIPGIIELGLSLRVHRVSFLAVDVLSGAFARDRLPMDARNGWQLNLHEAQELREIVSELRRKNGDLFASGFIAESPARLMQIADYFEALSDGKDFPRVLCNAPRVSAVITSTGDLLPCFFLPKVGNVREEKILSLLNSLPMMEVRREVRAYSLERCHTCVCSLNIQPLMALANSF